MHPALITLLRLRGWSLVRRVRKGLRKPAGIALAIFAGCLGFFWLISLIVGSRHSQPADPAAVRLYGPAALAGMAVLNVFGARQGMRYSAAEVDLLIAGPFSRRDLLTYKAVIGLLSAVGAGVWVSLFMQQLASRWIFMFVAATLALAVLNMLAIAVVLGQRYVGTRVRRRWQKAVIGVFAVLVVAAVVRSMPIDPAMGPLEAAQSVLASPVVQTLLLPFSVFTMMLTAGSWAVVLPLVVIALLMWCTMFALAIWLDERCATASVEQDAHRHEKAAQARKRSGMPITYARRAARWQVGGFPWLAGAGPMIQRQLITASRSMKALWVPMVALLAAFGWPVAMVKGEGPEAILAVIGFGMFMVAIAMPQMLPFDFRGDLDQMDWLKMLPIRPLPMALGELVTPVLMLTLSHWLLLALAAAIAPRFDLFVLLAIALLALPLNLLIIALENAMFLAYPTRTLASGTMDLASAGRNATLFVAKMIILMLVIGAAAPVALLAWWLSGESLAIVTITAWSILAAAGAIVIYVVSRLFAAFDVSRDMPP